MTQSPDEDLALVESARAGEQDAFESLFEKYRDRAAAVAYKYVHNREDALDVVQDAFVKAFGSLNDFREESRFSHWFFRIVVNRAIDMLRRNKPPEVTYDEARESEGLTVADGRSDANPVENVVSTELQEAYEKAVKMLSPEHREVFIMHTSRGMRYADIATELDLPIGTVMSRLHYARKHLERLLKPFMPNAD